MLNRALVETKRLLIGQLEQLEAKAAKLGDYVLGGHLLREVDAIWFE